MNHILIVDDEEAVCWAMKKALGKLGHQVAVASSAEEAFRLAAKQVPDAIILDVRLPGLNGLECQRRLTTRNDTVPVIFLTGHGDIAMSVRAMKSGAYEFLTKPFKDDELIDAVRLALARDGQERSRRAETDALRRRFESLTPREREIMQWVASGKTDDEIGDILSIGATTVTSHVENAKQKLDAFRRTYAVVQALRFGEITL